MINGDHGFENGLLVPIEATELDVAAAEFVEVNGADLETLALARGVACGMAADILRPMLQLILDSENRAYACDVLSSAFGLAIREGVSDEDLAVRYGVSKQAILNAKNDVCRRIGVKFVTRGGKQNKSVYEKTNFRHLKRQW